MGGQPAKRDKQDQQDGQQSRLRSAVLDKGDLDLDLTLKQAAEDQARKARKQLERRDPLWPAHLMVLAAILIGLAVPHQLTIGRPVVFPSQIVLFAGLIVTTPRHPRREEGPRRLVRIALVGLVSATAVMSLLLLTRELIEGRAQDAGPLLLGGVLLWLISVLLFTLWFWELDRGGPIRRGTDQEGQAHFLFPQMSEPDWTPGWWPGLADYFYLSLTNAASFAPPETMPLTKTAQLLMGTQTLASLLMTTIVLAYAVNNLS